MARKNRRVEYDLSLPTIKEDRRPMPKCKRFPGKTVFTTGYRAQVAVDEIQARSDRDKTPVRVYSCEINEGGCGYFHITSQSEYKDDHNDAASYPTVGSADNLDRNFSNNEYSYDIRNSGYRGAAI